MDDSAGIMLADIIVRTTCVLDGAPGVYSPVWPVP